MGEGEEEEEGTLGEAVEGVKDIPGGVEVDPTILERVKKNECCFNEAGHGQVTIILL